MTERQERAKLRNWQKAKLIAFKLDESVLTEEEKELHRLIMEHKKTLLDFWDAETEKTTGHPPYPYKCIWCGRRSLREHLIGEDNYCKKHFKELNEHVDYE